MKTEQRSSGLYGLSLIVGLLGTGLTVALEVRESKDSSSLPDRALYTFILFIAGLLFQAARLSSQPQASAPSAEKLCTSHVNQAVSPNDLEEKSPLASPLFSSHSVVIPLMELKSTPAKKAKISEARFADNKEPAEEAEEPTSRSSSAMSHPAQLPVQSRWSSSLTFVRDVTPITWWAQSLMLFMQNALEESAISQLLPYTTLTGLASGYLLRISLNPWQLCGIRRWIENHHNELLFPEYVVYVTLLKFQAIKAYFLFATTASFWTGYNVEEFTTLITAKLLQQSSSSNTSTLHEQPFVVQTVLPRLPTAMLTAFSGAVLTGLSLLVIQQPTDGVDQTALRNSGALWMASIGNYALTYPLGIYLGRYLPRRYHENALIAATYLLVPFASPDLTIPHYLLLSGAGLCGGVAHFIIKDRYLHQLAQMQQRQQLIDALLGDAQPFLQLLPQLSLPDDLLLRQAQQKKQKMTWILKISLIVYALSALPLILDSIITHQPKQLIFINLLFLFNVLSIYLGSFYLLPQQTPSVYTFTPLSQLKQFLYRDSFSLTFLFKIGVILYTKIRLLTATQNTSPFNALLFNLMIYILTTGYTVIKAFSKRTHGYQPYVPRTEDIQQLAAALKTEALEQRRQSGETRLSCSYHLLKFMQENSPPPLNIPALTGSDSSAEDKVPLHPLLNPEDKLQEPPSRLPSPSWSPRLLWQPLPKNNPPEMKDGLLPVPVAALYPEHSAEPQLTLEVDFNSPYDQSYTRQRLDIDFELCAADAAIRGPLVAEQFKLGLPQGLSLTPSIKSFSF